MAVRIGAYQAGHMSEPVDVMDSAVALCRAATRLAQRMRAERPADGLTMSMLSVLSHLYQQGPLTAGRLATLQRLRPQTLTRTLARLEERDLVRRRPDPADRRQSRIELTPDGHAALRANLFPRAAWLAEAMTALSPTERGVLRLAADLMEELADRDVGSTPGVDHDSAEQARALDRVTASLVETNATH